jgi:hypothetical protein
MPHLGRWLPGSVLPSAVTALAGLSMTRCPQVFGACSTPTGPPMSLTRRTRVEFLRSNRLKEIERCRADEEDRRS